MTCGWLPFKQLSLAKISFHSSSMQWLVFGYFSRSDYCYDCDEVQPIFEELRWLLYILYCKIILKASKGCRYIALAMPNLVSLWTNKIIRICEM